MSTFHLTVDLTHKTAMALQGIYLRLSSHLRVTDYYHQMVFNMGLKETEEMKIDSTRDLTEYSCVP